MAKSIKFKNDIYLDNTGIHRDIAIGYYNKNKNVNAENLSFNFDKAVIIGNKLSFKNGKIYVGKNVKRVKVNAIAFLENMNYNNIGYIWFFIQKNGADLCNSIVSGVGQFYQSVCITDFIADVKENDYFSLKYNNPNYDKHIPVVRSGLDTTRLYIEVIE